MVCDARATAFAAASSQDFEEVPTISMTFYTLSGMAFSLPEAIIN
jgi:hypothetical protein